MIVMEWWVADKITIYYTEYAWLKDFESLLSAIEEVLATVDGVNSSDYSVLAKDIATYERNLAMV